MVNKQIYAVKTLEKYGFFVLKFFSFPKKIYQNFSWALVVYSIIILIIGANDSITNCLFVVWTSFTIQAKKNSHKETLQTAISKVLQGDSKRKRIKPTPSSWDTWTERISKECENLKIQPQIFYLFPFDRSSTDETRESLSIWW